MDDDNKNQERREIEDINEEYMILEKLGEGAYGVVVQVKNRESEEYLAMKVIDKMARKEDKFWSEANILAGIDSAHILKYYDAFHDADCYYLVTELLIGGELFDEIIKYQVFSERKASLLIKSMLHAIKHMHDRKIVHLDLKPENFVFSGPEHDEHRQLKLIDFGTARIVQDDENVRVRCGTPFYIAPQMLAKNRTKDGQVLRSCDMWSIGVICYVLVTGEVPFGGRDRKSVMRNILTTDFEFPKNIELSNEVRDLICHLLERDSHHRFTVDQALAHAWIDKTEEVSDDPLHESVVAGIQDFWRDTVLKKCLARLLVSELQDDEKEVIKEMFDEWDANNDGVLTVEELLGLVNRLGYDALEAVTVAEQLVKEFDIDNNGVIDISEFSEIGTRGLLELDVNVVNEIFDVIDRDHNGYVSKEEFELYFGEHPDLGMEVNVLRIMQEADANHDGQISRDEFLLAMQSLQE